MKKIFQMLHIGKITLFFCLGDMYPPRVPCTRECDGISLNSYCSLGIYSSNRLVFSRK